MFKNTELLEEVCDVTLVSEDNERIREHMVVLAPVSTPSGTKNTKIHTMKLCISKDYSFKIHDILGWSDVQCRIFGELKRLWRFPENLKKYKMLQRVKQIKSGAVFTIKASVRLVLADCFTILIHTLRLILGGNPVETVVTQNDL